MKIVALTINTHQTLLNAHNAFHSSNRREARPFEQADGVEHGICIKNPAAGLMSLAAVQAATPALLRRQAKRGEPFSFGMLVRVGGAGGQFRQVLAR